MTIGTLFHTLHSLSKPHGIHGSLILSSLVTLIGLSMQISPLPPLNLDFDAHGNYRHSIAQSAATLTTDDEPPDDHGDYNPSTWASLMEEAFDGIVASCVLQAILHRLSMQVLKPPWALILFPTTCYLLTMDHLWWFQPHRIMTCYTPCLPGFLMTSLGKPLTSPLSMPTFLTTLFSASILNCQMWP